MFFAIPIMDYRQYRGVRRLVHSCCNYDSGNCLALDDGEECVRVQSISHPYHKNGSERQTKPLIKPKGELYVRKS